MTTDSVLPPFSGDRPTCPKCRYVGASAEFLPYGDCTHSPGANAFSGWHANERLHRACSRCGYMWDEATADA